MTYTADLASDAHRRALYVAFDGIETRVSTRNLTGLVSGTFVTGLLLDSISGGERSLDFEHGIVLDAGVSFSVVDSDTTRALFVRRGGTETTIVNCTSSSTSITLKSATNTYANGATIYVGRETIVLGTHTGSGTYTGCTRGAFGSTASTHAENEVVSSVPRHWYGRRCTIYDVNVDTGTQTALWYGALSSSPTVSSGVRAFEATSRMDEWLTRPICSGFREYTVDTSTMVLYPNTSRVAFVFADPVEQYEFAAGTNGGWLRVEVDDRVGFFFFDAVSSAGITISMNQQWAETQEVGSGDFGFTTSTALRLEHFQTAGKITCRQVELVNGPLSVALLAVIRSRTGNDAFDILPGRESNAAGAALSYFYRKRMGAGIPSAEVEVTSWQQIVGGSTTAIEPLLEEERLGAFFERALWRTGGYAYTTSSGKLAWRKYDGVAIRASVTSYNGRTDFLYGDVVASDDEADTPGGATVKGNFSPISEEYKKTIDLLWFDDADIYGDRDQRYQYESRSLRLGSGQASFNDVEVALDRRRARRLYAGRKTSYRAPWRLWQSLLPGTRISLTDDRLDDGEGGVGVSGRYYEIVRFAPDWVAGYISVELDEVYRTTVYAPSARISAATGGANPTLTLATDIYDDDGTPGLYFPDGCTIQVRDATDNYLTTTNLTVVSTTANTVVCSGTPSFTLAVRDLVEMVISGDTGSATVYGTDVEDFAFAADANLLIDTGADERDGPRWG